jgi:RNA polymerase sigma factor (sigma-70 family)
MSPRVSSSDDSRSPPPSLRAAFERLVARHAADVDRLIRRKLGRTLRRRLDSQDLRQEVLLDALRLFEAGGVDPEIDKRGFLRWLAAIVDNKVKALARFHVQAQRRSVRREVPLEAGLSGNGRKAPPAAGGKTASSVLMNAERRERLDRALARLSPRERQVVDLVHLQGLRVGEAAAALGKTPNATSVLLYHALAKLGEILKGEDET